MNDNFSATVFFIKVGLIISVTLVGVPCCIVGCIITYECLDEYCSLKDILKKIVISIATSKKPTPTVSETPNREVVIHEEQNIDKGEKKTSNQVDDKDDETKQSQSHLNPVQCSSIQTCSNIKSLIKALQTYQNAKEVDDMNLSDITNIATILDSYLHFLSKHASDAEFECIFKQLNECAWANCSKLRRNYRDRMKQNNFHFKDLCVEEKVYFEIMDKIHCYFYHSYHVGHRTTSVEHEQKKQFDPPNRVEDSKFGRFTISQNDLQNVNGDKMFSYGYAFVYNHFDLAANLSKYSSYPISYKDKSLLSLKKKYDSLKEELTENPISKLTNEQYNSELRKATQHHSSLYCKRLMGSTLNLFVVQLEHILCFMVYCNYTHYQYTFSKTYRENGFKDHVNFFHFASTIQGAVETAMATNEKAGDIHAFYHGVGEQLVFPLFTFLNGIRCMCPLSTSSSFEVATNFTEQCKGIIVEFGSNSGECSYFSLSWVSDFAAEKEYLFTQNVLYNIHAHLKIKNIIDAKNGFQCIDIINDLKYLNTHLFRNAFTNNNECVRSKVNELLSNISIALLESNNSDNCMNEYGKKLIKGYFNTTTQIEIALENWLSCKNVFKSGNIAKYAQFNLRLIFKLFSNIEELTLTISEWNAHLWKEMIDHLCSPKISENSNKYQKIMINVTNCDDQTLFNIVDQYSMKLRQSSMCPIFVHSKDTYVPYLPGNDGNVIARYNVEEKKDIEMHGDKMKCIYVLRLKQDEIIQFLLKIDRKVYFVDFQDELLRLICNRLQFDESQNRMLKEKAIGDKIRGEDFIMVFSKLLSEKGSLMPGQREFKEFCQNSITKLHIFPDSLLVKAFQLRTDSKYLPLLEINQYFSNIEIMCIHDFELSHKVMESILSCVAKTISLRTICIITGKYKINNDFIHQHGEKAKKFGFSFSLKSNNVVTMSKIYLKQDSGAYVSYQHKFELPSSQVIN